MPVWLAIAILGVVEGITEFLPVSSTGHLLIAEHLGLPPQSDLFNIVIQSGATLAVIPLFWGRIEKFITRWNDPATFSLLMKVITAFVITGIGGFILDKKGLKLPENLEPVAIALLVGGVVFILVEQWLAGKTPGDEVTWAIAVAVGLGQLVAAVFPGASRSGTTIILALVLGLNRFEATEFSFLAGIPTMLAAGGYKMFKAFHHPKAPMHEDWNMLILATIVSGVVSFIAVKWLLQFVKTHTFKGFGWYRIVIGGAVLALVLAGMLR
jgi:undecaprenyl-diphosphatase